MARPTKLPDARDRILDAVRDGLTRERAAEVAGVGASTFYAWLQRGRAEAHRIDEGLAPRTRERPFLEFLEALKEADAEGEATLVARIREAVATGGRKTRVVARSNGTVEETVEELPGHWQAAAWILERRWPERWRRRESIDVAIDDDEVAARLAAVARTWLDGMELDAEARARETLRLAELLRSADGEGVPR